MKFSMNGYSCYEDGCGRSEWRRGPYGGEEGHELASNTRCQEERRGREPQGEGGGKGTRQGGVGARDFGARAAHQVQCPCGGVVHAGPRGPEDSPERDGSDFPFCDWCTSPSHIGLYATHATSPTVVGSYGTAAFT